MHRKSARPGQQCRRRQGLYAAVLMAVAVVLGCAQSAKAGPAPSISVTLFPGADGNTTIALEGAVKTNGTRLAVHPLQTSGRAGEHAAEHARRRGHGLRAVASVAQEGSVWVTVSARPWVRPGTYQGKLVIWYRTANPAAAGSLLDADGSAEELRVAHHRPPRFRPRAFPITITVVEPSPLDIPDRPASPSPARVVEVEEGTLLVRDELVVMLGVTTPLEEARATAIEIALQTGGVFVGSVPETRTFQIRYDVTSPEDLEPIRERIIASFPEVLSVANTYLAAGQAAPNDSLFAGGQQRPAFNLIRAQEAWDLTTGANVPVAILDCNYAQGLHGDWVNAQRLGGGAGCGTTIGSHGTRVAGIVGAKGNNTVGMAGMGWDLALRVYGADGATPNPLDQNPASVTNAVTSVDLSALMKDVVDDPQSPRVANISLGFCGNAACGGTPSQQTQDCLQRVNDTLRQPILYGLSKGRDILWVFAAGNQCRDARFQSPAGLTSLFPLNTMSVAAAGAGSTQSQAVLWPDSNRGSSVSVAAPGEGIWGTTASVDYEAANGTSFAAPFVSGLAALVRSAAPDFPSWRVKRCIVGAADIPVSGETFKVIDAANAIPRASSGGDCPITLTLPPRPIDLVLSVDLTGSMGQEIERVRNEIRTIIRAIRDAGPLDLRIAVVSHEDYPTPVPLGPSACSAYSDTYGSLTKPDAAFRRQLPLTPSVSGDIDTAVNENNLFLGFGADGPESYGRVFWEVAQCGIKAVTPTAPHRCTRPEFDVGFRPNSLKFIVAFGDNLPHDNDLTGTDLQGILPLDRYVIRQPVQGSTDTGIDPGRNETIDCAFDEPLRPTIPRGDDIDFQGDALRSLDSAGIKLIFIDSAPPTELANGVYWAAWTAGTGGAYAAINPDGSLPAGQDLGKLIVWLLYQATQGS